MTARLCAFLRPDGTPCQSAPLRDGPLCFFHAPETQKDASEARRLGGLRRRREGSVAGAYEYDGIATVPAIRRLLEVAVLDTLALENSLSRNRTIVQLVMAASKLLELGEIEQRVERLGTVV